MNNEMNFKRAAEKIIDLKKADLKLRDRLAKDGKLGEGYDSEMAKLHDRNAEILNDIIDAIGYPTIDKVGKEASDAAWLVIQHSITRPIFMKRCVALLEAAVEEHKADPKHLAYLTDRVAVFQSKPQLYGTQFDWDEKGELSPNLIDDFAKVNERRKSIGLNTLGEQTAIIRKQAENENQTPPNNFKERKMEIDKWRKELGWIQ
jgi:hypothetical protein